MNSGQLNSSLNSSLMKTCVSSGSNPERSNFQKIICDDPKFEELSGEFAVSSYGVKLHASCVKKFGDQSISSVKGKAKDGKFSRMVQTSLKKGFLCLANLNTESSRQNLENLKGVVNNLKTPMKIVCNEGSLQVFRGVGATAKTSPPGDKAWPKMSLNPSIDVSNEKLQKIIFHEYFHLIGIAHTLDIEYGYSCADCCQSEENSSVKNMACKICKGDYEGITSADYRTDLFNYYRKSQKFRAISRDARKYLTDYPKNAQAKYHLAAGLLIQTPLLGFYYAKRLLKSNIEFSAADVAKLNEFVDLLSSKIDKNSPFKFVFYQLSTVFIETPSPMEKGEEVMAFREARDEFYKISGANTDERIEASQAIYDAAKFVHDKYVRLAEIFRVQGNIEKAEFSAKLGNMLDNDFKSFGNR